MQNTINYDAFIDGYITCALWSSSRDEETLWDEDLSDETRLILINNCHKFLTQQVVDILTFSRSNFDNSDKLYSQAGHSFWLNHNEHGSGFWDYPEKWGHSGADKLSDLSDEFDGIDLYIGDDGKIYS